MKKIPNNLQGVLWSTPIQNLDINDNKVYIIHQVLMFGDLDQIGWLFKVYSKKQITDVFLNRPQKVYTKQALNYVNDFVLGIGDTGLSEAKYVNTIS